MRFLIITLLSFYTIGCAAAQESIVKSAVSSIAGQVVPSPKVPTTLSFAGESVPLEDIDVEIALKNEILVTKYMHSRTMRSLLDSRRYFAIIEPILAANGVPDDFKYLCVAESSLDPNAYSYAKAAGLWQFLAATGKMYNLEVGTTVDERYHIEKSTVAACKYLKDAYKKFGSWTMAGASYNVGQAGLSRRALAQKEDSFYDLILPTETMRYIYRILTYKILCESPESMGFFVADDEYYKNEECKEITVSSATINWVDVAKNNNTTYKKIRTLNPWIRDYNHTNSAKKSYIVKIPVTAE